MKTDIDDLTVEQINNALDIGDDYACMARTGGASRGRCTRPKAKPLDLCSNHGRKERNGDKIERVLSRKTATSTTTAT